MNVQPLDDRVLVKPQDMEEKVGSIIIPDTAKEKPMEGEVIATGPGKIGKNGKRIPLEVKAGDKIMFSKYAGTEIKIEGEEHLFMNESEILGILN